MSLQQEFEQKAAHAKTLGRQDDDTMLDLYALFKQATQGDVSGDEPGMFDFVNRAKYDAWSNYKGINQEAAMKRYIALVDSL